MKQVEIIFPSRFSSLILILLFVSVLNSNFFYLYKSRIVVYCKVDAIVREVSHLNIHVRISAYQYWVVSEECKKYLAFDVA